MKKAPGDNFGHKLGHSIYFYTKKGSAPVNFIPPSFALKDIKEIPRYTQPEHQHLTVVIYGGWNGEVALIPSMTAKKLSGNCGKSSGVSGITLKTRGNSRMLKT